MHVGILCPDLSTHNGWATYSLNLIVALRRHNIPLTIIAARNCPEVPFPVARWLPALTPPDSGLLIGLGHNAAWVRSALAACTVLHTTAEPYAPLLAAVRGQRPAFITGHGSYVHLPRVRRFPVNRLYGWAFRQAVMLCVSHYTAQTAGQIVPGLRTRIIPNAVDAARFAALERRRSLPADAPALPPDAPIILTAGGVKVRKGTLPLVQAIAEVRQQFPDVQCVVLGSLTQEPAYVAQVRAAIADHDLHDNVHLLGFVSEAALLAWYAAADVFVLPSINQGWKFEGFGLVHLEASAAGLPVIGTTGCGAAEAIDDERTGLLVDQARLASDLPAALLRLLRDPDLRARLGSAGRAKATATTWDTVARQVMAAYAEATAHH